MTLGWLCPKPSSRSAHDQPSEGACNLNAITNIFRVAELRRGCYTLALLAVYRLGIFINTPGVDRAAMNAFMEQQSGRSGRPVQHVLGRRAGADVDLRPGHHAVRLGIDHHAAARGGGAVPRALQKEGEVGRQKINQYTRYGTIVAVDRPGLGIARWLASLGRADQHPGVQWNSTRSWSRRQHLASPS